MAFNTYSDLKLSIISWVENDSVTTSHLRDFINRYAGKRSISTFNFKTDEIESVTCVTS